MGNHAGARCAESMCLDVEIEFVDGKNSVDPAGTIFPETLAGLSELERLLLGFCSSSNLLAVRWLFALGARADVSDSNGTTCLHVACRMGSLAVVRELVDRCLPLNSADVAGWTPMHVACFMERRSVGLYLMQSGAELMAQNLKGVMPVELCCDARLRQAIRRCRLRGPDARWKCAWESEAGESAQVTSCLQFEPTLVQREPALKGLSCTAMLELGVDIFNQQPGQGLAFLVATGTLKDSPAALSAFMLENRANPIQVGEFLSRDCSFSQALRLQVISKTNLFGTGVVRCLATVFKSFRMPSDLHKIDRLAESTAQIWWKQHEQLKLHLEMMQEPGPHDKDASEVGGLRLMHQLASHGALHQLLLSTILLHQNLHTSLPPSERVSLSQWEKMNAVPKESNKSPMSVDCARMRAMTLIHRLIYIQISRTFLPQLQFWPGQSGSADVRGPPNTAANKLPESHLPKLIRTGSSAGGRATLVGGSLTALPGSPGTVGYRHLWSLLSERASAAATSANAAARSSSCASDTALSGYDRRHLNCTHIREAVCHEGVWLSLQHGLLFLAHKPSHWTPYAFIHMGGVDVVNIDKENVMLTLVMGRPHPWRVCSEGNGAVTRRSPRGPTGACQLAEDTQLQLIFLLPDGTWQATGIPHLKIQLPDLQELQLWKQRLEEHALLTGPGEIFSSQEGRPEMPAL